MESTLTPFEKRLVLMAFVHEMHLHNVKVIFQMWDSLCDPNGELGRQGIAPNNWYSEGQICREIARVFV